MSVTDINVPSITTLTIEVKVIKIGKKQCTIAVFNQLPYLKVKLKDDLNGINIWGRVNRPQDWYVVTEYDGKLYRTILPVKKNMPDFKRWVLDKSHPVEKLGLSIGYGSIFPHYLNGEYIDGIDSGHDRCIFKNYDSFIKVISQNPEYADEVKRQWEYEIMAYEKWNEFVEKCIQSDQLFIAV